MRMKWKRKRISWTASALAMLLLAGQTLPSAALAGTFEFVEEEAEEEWESELPASESELSASRSELLSLQIGRAHV